MGNRISLTPHPADARIGVLSMHDAKSKNTFVDAFVEELMEVLAGLQKNKDYRVILLTGLKDVFCAGASKEALMSIFDGELEVKDLALSELLLNVPVPMIAASEMLVLNTRSRPNVSK